MFVAFALPVGLTLNSSIGVISGSVAHAGTYRIDLEASSDGKTYGRGELILTVAGPAPTASANSPQTVTAAPLTTLNVASKSLTQTVQATSTMTPYVSTFAGSYAGDVDGPGPLALFTDPAAVSFDKTGNIYVADTGNCAIRRISVAGVVTTLAGPSNQGETITTGSTDGTGTGARFNFPGEKPRR